MLRGASAAARAAARPSAARGAAAPRAAAPAAAAASAAAAAGRRCTSHVRGARRRSTRRCSQVALQVRVVQRGDRPPARRLSAGSSRDSAGAGHLADARQELGAHLRRRSAWGRASPAPAGRRLGARRRGAAAPSPATCTPAASSNQRRGLEAGIGAAIGQRQAGGEALQVVADRLRRTAARRRHRPRPTRAARPAGSGSCCFSSSQQHLAAARPASAVSISARGPLVQPVGDGHVVLAVADHLDDLLLQALMLLAQHLHLPLLQRHRALAVRAGQLHGGQQLGMALEEAGRVHQVVGDVVFGDALDASQFDLPFEHGLRPGRSSAPARPMPAHSMVSRPPRVSTSTCAVEPAQPDAGHHRGAGAGAAGQRLAGAALEHAQRDVACATPPA